MFRAKGKLFSLLTACFALLLTLVMGVATINLQSKTASAETKRITFNLGADGSASHYDGTSKSSYSETVEGYTLSLTNVSNFYTGARDAKGNSCIKLGASSKAGGFSFTAHSDVTSVVLYVGKYKANTTKLNINGTAHTLIKSSNNGEYDVIIVDTSSTKSITLTTVSGGYRAMVNTIEFVIADPVEPEKPTCEHTETETEELEATCTVAGYSYKKCSACGMEIEGTREDYEALGHEFTEFVETILPTETEQGYDVYECVRCKEIENRNVTDPTGRYSLIFNVPTGVTAIESKTDIVAMSIVTLPIAENKDEYTFEGWVTEEVSDLTEKPECYKGEYRVTADTVFYALYSHNLGGGSGTGNYIKVTTDKTDWSGEYLIVYEAKKLAFNGGLGTLDATGNSINVTITDNQIEASEEVDAAIFTFASVNGGYSIQSSSGYYIGRTATSNGFNSDKTTAYVNKISYSNDTVIITSSGGPVLQYYDSGTNSRFRYYASKQQALSLYEKDGVGGTVNYTTSFNKCEHTETETVKYKATCTEGGYTYEKCSACGMEIEGTRETFEALGHGFTEFVETILPTETEQGYDVYKCVRCEETEKQNFVDPTTEYTVEFVVPDGIEEISSITDAVGSEITLPTAKTVLGVEFLGWTTAEYAENEACPEILAGAYTLTGNKTLYALYSYTQGTGDFIKVTENKADWSGEYLIVYEDGENAYIFNGVDAVNGYVFATTKNGRIIKNSALNAVTVTIAAMEDGYSVLSNNGYIYGESNGNALNFNKTAKLNTIDLAKDGSIIITSGRVLRFNDASNQMRFRYYTAGTQAAVYLYEKDGTTYYSTTLPTLTTDIETASLTIGANLAVNYYVKMSDVYAAAQMRFSMEGLDDVYVNGVKQTDGRYKFTFTNIPPQRMGDNIFAELIFADNIIATQAEYSIQTYAINQLKKSGISDELKQLIVDMLYYGAAAQEYKGYKADALATNGLSETASEFVMPEEIKNWYVNNTEISSYPAYFTNVGVWFDYNNQIYVTLNTTENVKITVDGEEVAVDGTRVLLGGILATEYDKQFEIKLYSTKDGEEVLMQTLTYSVNFYVYQICEGGTKNQKMVNLAKALYCYGQSALAYQESVNA